MYRASNGRVITKETASKGEFDEGFRINSSFYFSDDERNFNKKKKEEILLGEYQKENRNVNGYVLLQEVETNGYGLSTDDQIDNNVDSEGFDLDEQKEFEDLCSEEDVEDIDMYCDYHDEDYEVDPDQYFDREDEYSNYFNADCDEVDEYLEDLLGRDY